MNDFVQRGLYRIILEAFLKAKAMGMRLLFDKDKAFCEYLWRIPQLPLSMAGFLDGLYRYIDLKEPHGSSAKQKALYDLLKPVRLGLEPLKEDWPKWYNHTMGKCTAFCSSCGNEMLQDFFSMDQRLGQPRYRICAGCTLRKWLDGEVDHGKQDKRDCLKLLFPAWKPNKFNHEARMDSRGRDLLRLKTKTEVQPAPPPLQVNANGHVFQPAFNYELVRDNKVVEDSLQDLPGLRELADDNLYAMHWAIASYQALDLDIERTTAHALRESFSESTDDVPAFGNTRIDGGMPDHLEELQPFRGERESHNFKTVSALQARMDNLRW